jgi:tripartite ATP-independent transporter DctM subunit
MKVSQLYEVILSSAKTTSVVMLLVAAAMVSSWLVTIADLPGQLADLLAPFMDNQTLLLLVMMALIILVGTVMDMTPTILILTPVLMPAVIQAGIDPVYFGVLFLINTAIGLITPPVGTVLNVVCSVAKLDFEEIVRGVWPFMIAQFVVLLLLVLFPQLVMGPLKFFTG